MALSELQQIKRKKPQIFRFEAFSFTWFPCFLVEISGIEPLTLECHSGAKSFTMSLFGGNVAFPLETKEFENLLKLSHFGEFS